MNTKGKLIVFEGADEVGKTTLVEAAVSWYQRKGVETVSLAFPGRAPGTLGSHVYDLHHDPSKFGITGNIPAEALQIMHVAAHFEGILHVIKPALSRGAIVILDRFWWSTWVYGIQAGIRQEVLRKMLDLEQSAWGGICPSLLILVTRQRPLRTVDNLDSWKCIQREYLRLAREQSTHHRIETFKNTGAINEAKETVADILERSTSDSPVSLSTEKTDKTQTELSLFAVYVPLAPIVPTVVYDTYWRFAAERQAVFFRKQIQPKQPWTEDPVLQLYKFTNAYRASDRVSQYLIRNVIYAGENDTDELFFRIILFKLFNRIPTWEALSKRLGQLCWRDYSFERYDKVLSGLMDSKQTIYSAAYIMSSGRSAYGAERKHRNHLRMLEAMMAAELPKRITNAKRMQDVFELLLGFPSIGVFLAYQYSIDINYSPLTNFSEMEFVVPGPGAKDGITKCFSTLGGLNHTDIIRFVTERQEMEFERLDVSFRDLWGRKLQLIDCQNLFCEVDKYARVAHPDVLGISGRARIKQKYSESAGCISYWYPPKWGINERIKQSV